jgi:ferric-dicitrate binding protein FerR (iron transport regulator)
MKEEKLVRKWLKNELTSEELEAFKKLDAYSSYAKISEEAKKFKAPIFDESSSLQNLKDRKATKSNTFNFSTSKFVAAVVAVFIIVFAVIKLLNTEVDLERYQTDVARTEVINLPDNSEVNINANSSLTYNSSSWDQKRKLQLEGEAFFKVKTGEKFTVSTTYGDVEVLGTQFNVKSRDYGFEVTCYEGKVRVLVNDESYILSQKDRLVLNDSSVETSQTTLEKPDWFQNSTIFQSTSLDVVLKEFQNYYNVDFETSNINTSRLYTGSFNHSDIEIALKSITLPLNLTYQIKNKKVILYNK